MTAPISNGPTTHGYTTMRDTTSAFVAVAIVECGMALAFGLVKGLGIRCLENQGGWPEWLLVPGLVLAGLAVVLVRSDAWEGARLR